MTRLEHSEPHEPCYGVSGVRRNDRAGNRRNMGFAAPL